MNNKSGILETNWTKIQLRTKCLVDRYTPKHNPVNPMRGSKPDWQIFFGKLEASMFKLSSYSSLPKEISPIIPQQQHKYHTFSSNSV
ncbi:hypothetical protein MTR_8g086770 [Medicago truncatula]|uniref:Uncharacterized protein n=1 Tax=Medicago truncatula TaxID=3880 RepID=G7LJH3_MEDTR|nr:hypothetical protein MTR_8g086770 [Medicago truncatula]